MDLVISPLGEVHDRKSFDCGELSLNRYLHQYAGQDSIRHIIRVHVASPPETPQQVIGYYRLSASSPDADDLSEKQRKGATSVSGSRNSVRSARRCEISLGKRF